MATHFSILAWRIPWTEEPGGLQSVESQSQTRLSALAHAVIILSPHWGKMSPREVKRLAQRHTTNETGTRNLAFVTEETSG